MGAFLKYMGPGGLAGGAYSDAVNKKKKPKSAALPAANSFTSYTSTTTPPK